MPGDLPGTVARKVPRRGRSLPVVPSEAEGPFGHRRVNGSSSLTLPSCRPERSRGTFRAPPRERFLVADAPSERQIRAVVPSDAGGPFGQGARKVPRRGRSVGTTDQGCRPERSRGTFRAPSRERFLVADAPSERQIRAVVPSEAEGPSGHRRVKGSSSRTLRRNDRPGLSSRAKPRDLPGTVARKVPRRSHSLGTTRWGNIATCATTITTFT